MYSVYYIFNTIHYFVFQVFFVIRLHSVQASANLPPIQDPDPFINNDLMDGRDAFLTMAREKHYEFSSLRRVKFSSMALLYELHNSGKDSFVYTCNHCKNQVETRYHCRTCDVSVSLINHFMLILENFIKKTVPSYFIKDVPEFQW